ncbi:MAG: MBL fold metallo-hydrolase [Acidobacteria bacterium]|nr:MBL fold metallo-hydrolase [Acidobacteriota bacterium]
MIRKASAVMVTRLQQDLEVYLVSRNVELKFFGGYEAFPGGSIIEDDARVPISHLPENAGQEVASFYVSAARELFEEAGLWLGHGIAVGREALDEYRSRLINGNITFSQIIHQTRHQLDARDLEPVCRITTPPFAPVRFETQFFRFKPPASALPVIWPGELDHGEFLSPAVALQNWIEGELPLAPPVVLILQHLRGRPWDSFLIAVRAMADSYARGHLHQTFFTPGTLTVPLQTRTRPPATHTNAYLIGEQQFYLMDPGPEDAREQERLFALINETLQLGREFKGIIVTHGHPDHIGAAEPCARHYRVPAFTHPLNAHALSGIQDLRPLQDAGRLPLGIAPDGSPGWTLTAHHTPGHAPGHLCFQESRYQALFAGDMVSRLSSILIDPDNGGDMVEYLQSLERLQRLASGALYPAHVPPQLNGRKLIEQAISHRQKREEQVLEALRKGPQNLDQLVEKVYFDVDRIMWPLASRSLLAILQKLKREQKVREMFSVFGLPDSVRHGH